MPNRQQVRIACTGCRKKRAKCDGARTCERCQQADQECVYEVPRRTSKAEMREEVEQLRSASKETQNVFKLLLSLDAGHAHQVLSKMVHDNENSSNSNSTATLRNILAAVAAEKVDEPNDGPSAHDDNSALGSIPEVEASLVTDSSTATSSHSGVSTSPEASGSPALQELSPTTTVPSFATIAHPDDPSKIHLDSWTQTGWPVSRVHWLLESLFIWEYLPCCLLSKDLFLQDYADGLTRYCSRPLVYAALSLAVRLLEEAEPRPDKQADRQEFDVSELQSCFGGAFGLQAKAKQLLDVEEPQSPTLPNVQALGLLSLVHVRVGSIGEAREMSASFLTAATALCLRETRLDKQPEQHCRIRAMTYCGAVTLCRMLDLVAALRATSFSDAIQDDYISLEELPGGVRPRTGAPLNAAESNKLSNLPIMSAKLFQITEWVYKFLSFLELPGTGTSPSGADVVSVYKDCLTWYESVLDLLRAQGTSPPALSIHIYYQFCLLSIFKPFENTALDDYDINPRTVCLQAEGSIQALAKTYAVAFNLGRVPLLASCILSAIGPPDVDHDAETES